MRAVAASNCEVQTTNRRYTLVMAQHLIITPRLRAGVRATGLGGGRFGPLGCWS